VEVTAVPRPAKFAKAQVREMKAAVESIPWQPIEDRCCAELNDDGTIKLLMRAYGRTPESRPADGGLRTPSNSSSRKSDAFDLAAERAAISLLKLASWITTAAVVVSGF
jgi:hypothetical protein